MIKIRNIKRKDLTDLLWDKNLKKLRQFEENKFQRFLDKKLLWLVADNGKAVGQIRAEMEDSPTIFALRVKPSEQNKGIGSKLILKMEKKLKKLNFSEIFISVATDNPRAQKLYENLGYKVIKRNITDKWDYTDDNGNVCTIKTKENRLKKKL